MSGQLGARFAPWLALGATLLFTSLLLGGTLYWWGGLALIAVALFLVWDSVRMGKLARDGANSLNPLRAASILRLPGLHSSPRRKFTRRADAGRARYARSARSPTRNNNAQAGAGRCP